MCVAEPVTSEGPWGGKGKPQQSAGHGGSVQGEGQVCRGEMSDSLLEKQAQQGNVCFFFLKMTNLLFYGSTGQSPKGVSRGKDQSVGRAGSHKRLGETLSASPSQLLEAPRFEAPPSVLKPVTWALPNGLLSGSVVRFSLHPSFSFLDIYFLKHRKERCFLTKTKKGMHRDSLRLPKDGRRGWSGTRWASLWVGASQDM